MTLGPFALGRVHHADCLDAMRQLPPFGGVVITDPPWPCEIGEVLAGGDTGALLTEALLVLREKVRRIVVIVSCMTDPRWMSAVPTDLPFVRVCWLRYAIPGYCGTILRGSDVAYVFGDRSRPHGGVVLPGETTAVSCGKRSPLSADHPTPRNVEVMAWLVRWFSSPGEIVLDPFAGTGTTGAAAIRLGRRFLGFEIVERWADAANRRIDAEHERLGHVAAADAKPGQQAGLFAGTED